MIRSDGTSSIKVANKTTTIVFDEHSGVIVEVMGEIATVRVPGADHSLEIAARHIGPLRDVLGYAMGATPAAPSPAKSATDAPQPTDTAAFKTEPKPCDPNCPGCMIRRLLAAGHIQIVHLN